MSDTRESNKNEGEELGLFERVNERVGLNLGRLRDELGDNDEQEDIVDQSGPVRLPTDEDIVEVSVEALIKDKQSRKAETMDNPPEDHRTIRVELNIDDPLVVLHNFSLLLSRESENLLGYLHQNSLFEAQGPSLEKDDSELFTYIVDERDDDSRPAAFVGGAQPLRLNLANREGLTEDEKRLIRYAHVAAAKKNGYDRHVLLDEVLVVPKFEVEESPYVN